MFIQYTFVKCIENQENINLLTISDLSRYLGKEKCKIMHIGLIQVAFKPLTLLGTNTCMHATLRDGRCLDWNSSLIMDQSI